MTRSTVTTLFRAAGAKLHSRDNSTGWYVFPSEDKVYEYREKIPFLNLLHGPWDNGFMLIVYFDQLMDG